MHKVGLLASERLSKIEGNFIFRYKKAVKAPDIEYQMVNAK